MTLVADFVLQRVSERGADSVCGCSGDGIRTGTGIEDARQKRTQPAEHLPGRHS